MRGARFMTTEQIAFFLTLADCEHLTYAADKMHISQPALTHSLQRLEEELGAPLFDRKGRGIHLNEYGKIFQKHAREILYSLDNTRTEIKQLSSSISRTVNLIWFTKYPVEQHLIHFMLTHPDIELKQTHVDMPDIDRSLNDGTADFALITSIPERASSFSYVKAPVTSWSIALSVDHPLAGRQETPDLTEFSNDSFLSYSLDDNHLKMTKRICRKAGFECNIAYRTSPKYCLDLIIENNWVLFCPEDDMLMAKNNLYYHDKICFFPLGSEECDSEVRLLWNNRRHLSSPCQTFLEYMKGMKDAFVIIQPE